MKLIHDDFTIRAMKAEDREDVLRMMEVFYASEAIMFTGTKDVYARDFEACISDAPFVEGFVITDPKGNAKGYCMIAHSFSCEFGKPCVWIEDMYFDEEMRGKGAARAFFDYLNTKYPDCSHRIEAELENEHAIMVYKRNGFEEIPYVELIRNHV